MSELKNVQALARAGQGRRVRVYPYPYPYLPNDAVKSTIVCLY